MLGRCQIKFEPFRTLVLVSFQEMTNGFIIAKPCINYLWHNTSKNQFLQIQWDWKKS